MTAFAIAFVFGYLLGTIPFGLILTRMAGLGDLRAIGSGNIGATNVLRTGNRKLAGATLLLDGLKGAAAALIAGLYGAEYALIAGLAAFLGHLYPVWLGFKGGKGVATYIGVLTAIAAIPALVFALIWIAVAAAARYSSLAALVAAVAAPIVLYLVGQVDAAMVFTVMSALVFLKHRTNISRLLAGSESRIGSKG